MTLAFEERGFLIMAYSGIRGWSTFYKVRTIPRNNSLDAEMDNCRLLMVNLRQLDKQVRVVAESAGEEQKFLLLCSNFISPPYTCIFRWRASHGD